MVINTVCLQKWTLVAFSNNSNISSQISITSGTKINLLGSIHTNLGLYIVLQSRIQVHRESIRTTVHDNTTFSSRINDFGLFLHRQRKHSTNCINTMPSMHHNRLDWWLLNHTLAILESCHRCHCTKSEVQDGWQHIYHCCTLSMEWATKWHESHTFSHFFQKTSASFSILCHL